MTDISEHPHWDAFCEFHRANPHVYIRLLEMARELVTKGHARVGMKMLFEALRWERMLQTDGEPFKLNNNFHSLYARMLMELNEDLGGVFEVRGLVSA